MSLISEGLQYEHNGTVSTTTTELFDTNYNLITNENKDFTIFFKYDNKTGEISDGQVERPVLTYGSLDGLLLKRYQTQAKIYCNRDTTEYSGDYPSDNTTVTICIVKEGLTVKGIKEDGSVWATATLSYEMKPLTNTLIVGGECNNNSSEVARYHEVTFHNLLVYNKALTTEQITSIMSVLNS